MILKIGCNKIIKKRLFGRGFFMEKKDIKKSVYDFYDKIAKEKEKVSVDVDKLNKSLGYTNEDINNIPKGAQMGLGCGNPKERGKPRPGEIVADLGSGRGMDVFLASKAVGDTGLVIGIDSNYKMIEKAREIASKNGFKNTEFRLGEIEHLPIGDNTLDLLISNCVINLSTDKQQVYKEIYRVLKQGGRISISDIMLKRELSEQIKKDPNIYGT
jgi:arsenite methyltransferase